MSIVKKSIARKRASIRKNKDMDIENIENKDCHITVNTINAESENINTEDPAGSHKNQPSPCDPQLNGSENDATTVVNHDEDRTCSRELMQYIDKYKIKLHGIPSVKEMDKSQIVETQPLSDRKEKLWWSSIEVEYLKKGIDMFGCGRWTKILTTFKEYFKLGRRPCDLKDKYRSIVNHSSCVSRSLRNFVEVDSNHERIGDAVYRHIYPHQVAKEIAKIKGKDNMTIYIAYEDNCSETSGKYQNVFKYVINVVGGKIKVSRVVGNG